MSVYQYLKSTPKVVYPEEAVSLLSVHRNRFFVWASYLLIVIGVILIGNALLPIAVYELFTSPEIATVETPKLLVQTIQTPQQILAQSSDDLINADNWFSNAPQVSNSPSKIEYYNLTVPKLGIKDAIIKIGGTDLSKSLIHYQGTAIPGQLGNPVIFGHSVLPQFFNPKSYISIFSTLPTLKMGDEIYIDYDGVEYKYEVNELKEVKPTDVSVLEQRYDRKEVSLITCVPPGTYLRRLVVKAKLVENRK